MLEPPKSGKESNEKKMFTYNAHNNNELWTSLKISVFATNFAVDGFYESFERHFVKKIQH